MLGRATFCHIHIHAVGDDASQAKEVSLVWFGFLKLRAGIADQGTAALYCWRTPRYLKLKRHSTSLSMLDFRLRMGQRRDGVGDVSSRRSPGS